MPFLEFFFSFLFLNEPKPRNINRSIFWFDRERKLRPLKAENAIRAKVSQRLAARESNAGTT